jgi:hypothetical protein
MKIKKIAMATLVPVAVTGITVSGWAAVNAATDHPTASHITKHQAVHAPGHTATAADRSHASNRTASADTTSWWLQDVHRAAAKAARRAQAAASHKAKAASQPAASSSTSLFAGMSSFERCVAYRESGDNPTASSAGLFGILPATWQSLGYPGTAGEASVAMQKAAFNKLYAADGTQPWAPYDGC